MNREEEIEERAFEYTQYEVLVTCYGVWMGFVDGASMQMNTYHFHLLAHLEPCKGSYCKSMREIPILVRERD